MSGAPTRLGLGDARAPDFFSVAQLRVRGTIDGGDYPPTAFPRNGIRRSTSNRRLPTGLDLDRRGHPTAAAVGKLPLMAVFKSLPITSLRNRITLNFLANSAVRLHGKKNTYTYIYISKYNSFGGEVRIKFFSLIFYR